MKMVKSLLLGSAAGLVAVAGAQAADMPVKAAPVAYVKICSLYGDGFYYVPGTTTCLKLGGYLRVQTEYYSGASGQAIGGGTMQSEARFNRVDTQDIQAVVRALISVDVRDQTEFGTLRSYFRAGWDTRTPGVGLGPFTTPCSTAAANACGEYIDRAFIQWAGFTIGRAQSFFDLFTQGGAYSYLNTRTSGDTGASGEAVWAYTAQFGNGISVSISAEDPQTHNKANVVNDNFGGFFTAAGANGVTVTNNNGLENQAAAINGNNNGFTFPDVILNGRIDQSWGFFGVSGAIHQVAGSYYTVGPDGCAITQCVNNGHPADKYGWAVAAGGLLNLPGGDAVGANFVYTQGAIGYAQDLNNFDVYHNSNQRTVAWGVDGIYTNFGEVELTRAWSVNAAYQHIWTPKWRTAVWGGYANIHYDDAAKAFINAGLPAGNVCGGVFGTFTGWAPLAGNSCSPDFSFWQVGTRTQWNPHPLLDIGLEVYWTQYNTAYKGPVNWTAVNARPICTNTAVLGCAADDQGVFSAIFRWQRNFYP